jgi:hypothetical protein
MRLDAIAQPHQDGGESMLVSNPAKVVSTGPKSTCWKQQAAADSVARKRDAAAARDFPRTDHRESKESNRENDRESKEAEHVISSARELTKLGIRFVYFI